MNAKKVEDEPLKREMELTTSEVAQRALQTAMDRYAELERNRESNRFTRDP